MEIIKKIIHKIVILAVIIVLIIAIGFCVVKIPFVYGHPLIRLFANSNPISSFEPPQIHFYENPDISLEKIHIQAFLLTSKDNEGNVPLSWKEDFTNSLEAVKKFHFSQFGTGSEITYSLLDIPVIADEKVIDSIPAGIEHPTLVDLSPIDEFIDKNIISSDGSFYRKKFIETPENAFVVRVIFFEGPSAIGTDGLVILSRNYATEASLGYGTTILYHEFGHALGMPDLYDYETGEDFSDDIMGSGRWRDINHTYIGDNIKNKMTEK